MILKFTMTSGATLEFHCDTYKEVASGVALFANHTERRGPCICSKTVRCDCDPNEKITYPRHFMSVRDYALYEVLP